MLGRNLLVFKIGPKDISDGRVSAVSKENVLVVFGYTGLAIRLDYKAPAQEVHQAFRVEVVEFHFLVLWAGGPVELSFNDYKYNSLRAKRV